MKRLLAKVKPLLWTVLAIGWAALVVLAEIVMFLLMALLILMSHVVT